MILKSIWGIFDKLFFYYWKFYSNILRDNKPIMTSVFVVGATTIFIITTLMNLFLVTVNMKSLGFWESILISGSIVLSVLFYLGRKGKTSEIIRTTKSYKTHLLLSIFYLVFHWFVWGSV